MGEFLKKDIKSTNIKLNCIKIWNFVSSKGTTRRVKKANYCVRGGKKVYVYTHTYMYFVE